MIEAVIGGTLIGCAAVWLFLSVGRVAGISGIATQLITQPSLTKWPVWFIAGLGIGGWLVKVLINPAIATSLAHPAVLVAGGLLVGVGTRLGSGCTSGHGVCGVSRLSPRSIVATLVFLAVGMLVATAIGAL